jgi:putative glutamine amidotransferase
VEFTLLKAFVDAGKPVLGICRGHQLINVFFGGSLHQDLPEKSLHTNQQDLYITHCITAKDNSMLCKLYGPSFVVNSSHHQAVDRLGNDLTATAYWNDTYIEGFEHCSQRIYGVQWHPERMCVNEKRADTVDGIKIFEWFLNICKENRTSAETVESAQKA